MTKNIAKFMKLNFNKDGHREDAPFRPKSNLLETSSGTSKYTLSTPKSKISSRSFSMSTLSPADDHIVKVSLFVPLREEYRR